MQCGRFKSVSVPVIKNLKTKQIKKIQTWLGRDAITPVYFPDDTDAIIDQVFEENLREKNRGL